MLATVAINGLTCLGLLLALRSRLQGLPLRRWGRDGACLSLAGWMAAALAWALRGWFSWPQGSIGLVLQLAVPGSIGLLVYCLVGTAFGIAEVQRIATVIGRKLRRR